MFIVILGPDGSGKSTVANLLMSQPGAAFASSWRFHWRPNLLPKLGGSRHVQPSTSDVADTPATSSKYHGLVSLARFLYYWLDFVLGYWLVIHPRKARATLVLGERYFPDTLVHPERYGFSVPRWFMRFAARWVPAPDLLVLLKDEPEIIYARKPELPVDVIRAQIAEYEREMPYWGNSASVLTAGGPDAVADRLRTLVMSTLRAKHDAAPGWRAFPSASAVKVWMDSADSLHNALHLYHPYSRNGRRLKALVGALPMGVTRLWYRRAPDVALAEELVRYQKLAARMLDAPEAVVSFSMGTPGPHRKITAQASLNGRILAYIKIGKSEVAGKQLRQETEMLAWLERRATSAFVYPRVRATLEDSGDFLLALSAPDRPGRQRTLAPDRADALFLQEMATLGSGTMSGAAACTEVRIDTYLARMAMVEAERAAIVNAAREFIESCQMPFITLARHGDYAPWNTLCLSSGDLYVFDWEYAAALAPGLFDLMHRVFMPAWLVLNRDPIEIVDELLALGWHPVLGEVLGTLNIGVDDLPVYAMLYLVESGQRVADSSVHITCMREILARVGRTGPWT